MEHKKLSIRRRRIMGKPCHQLQKIKTHRNKGFISQCAQGCQILPQSMVVSSVFCHSPLFFVRKPLFRHISTMGTPCHQLKKIKTHINQGFISQCAQGCQIMPRIHGGLVSFWRFPLFSSENPSFDTCPPWGHQATNSKKSKPIATKV